MKPSICVIMSTYNGEKFLRCQIESILNQKNVDVRLFIRDDGSIDNTLKILNEYKSDVVEVLIGKNVGAKNSFLKALQEAPDADYYAFSDQDDVWDDDKLVVAINKIVKYQKEQPVLYSCRTRLVDANLNFIKNGKTFSSKRRRFLCGDPLSTAGCTMVFNKALKKNLELYMPLVFPMHDAWVSNVCLAIGGELIYDNIPHISYRQHGNNVIGGDRGIWKSIKRIIRFYRKMGRNYHIKMYKEIIENFRSIMPIENIARCEKVCNYKRNFFCKIKLLLDVRFWKGNPRWALETFLLVITNNF